MVMSGEFGSKAVLGSLSLQKRTAHVEAGCAYIMWFMWKIDFLSHIELGQQIHFVCNQI